MRWEGVQAVGRATYPALHPALLSPNPPGSGHFCHGPTSPEMGVPAALCTLRLCTFWGHLGVGTSLPTAEGGPEQAAGEEPFERNQRAAAVPWHHLNAGGRRPLRDAAHVPGLVLLRMFL